jgi:hypothetical protein
VKHHITDAYCINHIFLFREFTISEKYIVKYEVKSKLQHFFSKKSIKNFPLITQFFDVPFGGFRREIAGNGHSRLIKFKISGEHAPGPL